MLMLVVPARSNAEIADSLLIAESTAKTPRQTGPVQIDVHDPAQAVVSTYRSRLVTNGR